MPVYIGDADAGEKLAEVEGAMWWRHEANTDADSSFSGWLAAWQQYRLSRYEPKCSFDDFRLSSGVIYGAGGYSRYYVQNDGEICLLADTTRPEKVEKARTAGFTILP